MSELEINKLGVVGTIILILSLFVPWWEMSLEASCGIDHAGIRQSIRISLNLWHIMATNYPVQALAIYIVDFLPAIIFYICSIALGIAGSILSTGKKEMFISSGLFTILSLVTFTAILSYSLLKVATSYFLFSYPGIVNKLVPFPKASLFSSGSYTYEEVSVSYSTYLSIGFWLVLAAAIIFFVAFYKQLSK
ncbi:MAG: hypothetical protein QXK18_05835 [Candidatus Bathyarchaeia archaeon]